MEKKIFDKWWLPNLTTREMAVLKWISAIVLVVVCVALIGNLQANNIARAASNFGVMCLITAYAVGPQCWEIIDADEGSNSRKTLTLIAIFGFILNISGLIAHYTSP